MKIELAIMAERGFVNEIVYQGDPVWVAEHLKDTKVWLDTVTVEIDADEGDVYSAVVNGKIEQLRKQQSKKREEIQEIEESIQSLLAIENHAPVS